MASRQQPLGYLTKEQYSFIHAAVPIPCVDLLILRGMAGHVSEMLLVQRKNKPDAEGWWFPGGRLMRNEDVNEAARRIARDELGVSLRLGSIEPFGILNFVDHEDPFDHGRGTHTFSILVTAKLLDGAEPVISGPQHTGFDWWNGESRKIAGGHVCNIVRDIGNEVLRHHHCSRTRLFQSRG